jgi:hypothetical protein
MPFMRHELEKEAFRAPFFLSSLPSGVFDTNPWWPIPADERMVG